MRLLRVALLVLLLVTAGALFVLLIVFTIRQFGPQMLRRYLRAYGPAIRQSWFEDRAWVKQSLLSLVIVSSYLGLFCFSSMALHKPLPLAGLLSLVPLTLMSMLLLCHWVVGVCERPRQLFCGR